MKTRLFCAAAAVAIMSASPAFAQAYSGGNATFTGLGSDQVAYPGTTFDQATFTAATGTYTGPGTYNLNLVDFLAGINRNDSGTFTGTLTGLTGMFGGNPFTYTVSYSISIGASDTITFGGNYFGVLGQTVYINPLTLSSGGESAQGTLTVTTVPEPATWAMLLAGFGMIGFGMRYRKRAATTVTYA